MKASTAKRATVRLYLLQAALFGCALAGAAAPAHAKSSLVSMTLSASAGLGMEAAPTRALQAENLLGTFGVGFLLDCLRVELGVLGAFGTIKGDVDRKLRLELRPMLRGKLPIIPLYVRAIFAGVSPFAKDRNIAYGGGLGLAIPLGRLEAFVEAATLPRRVEAKTHWVVEARAGIGFHL